MKARNWTTWERHMPASGVGTRTGTATLCMKPWDSILPEEGVEERMISKEPLWRQWEMYLTHNDADVAVGPLGGKEEMPEKVPI
jgi:hypothetical protein